MLVLHAWLGLNDTVRAFCTRLAESGFVAFAPDLYRAPQLVWSPDVPRELRVDGAAEAGTILFHIGIRKDGRASQLRLKCGVLGLDSLGANLVGRYVYRRALSADHPVSVWFEVAVPVPKRARHSLFGYLDLTARRVGYHLGRPLNLRLANPLWHPIRRREDS